VGIVVALFEMLSRPYLRCYPGICLEELRKATENRDQDSRSPGLDLNPEPPEYEVREMVNHSAVIFGLKYYQYSNCNHLFMTECRSSQVSNGDATHKNGSITYCVCFRFLHLCSCYLSRQIISRPILHNTRWHFPLFNNL
jgi:hypothetical protein